MMLAKGVVTKVTAPFMFVGTLSTISCGMTLHHKPPVENRVKSTKSPCKRVIWGVK